MMAVADETFEFVSNLESWQQDLFLRAAGSPRLSPEDEAAAIELLVSGESDRGREVRPDDFLRTADDDGPLELLAIKNPTDVNLLASGAVLRFDRAKLNIVYGDNGAGKTGYSRIVKHVGRSLQREQILPDVLGQGDSSGRPRATLRASRAGDERDFEISLDEPGPAALGGINCYDTAAGERYLTTDSEVDYVPFALEGLQRLAAAQQQLSQRLHAEIERATPARLDIRAYRDGSRTKTFLEQLDASTDIDALKNAAAWTDTDTKRRESLRQAAAEIDAQHAKQLRAKALADVSSSRALHEILEGGASHLNASAIESARRELAALDAARKAADMRSSTEFAGSPIPGVGGDPWQVLWAAAKAYAEEVGHHWPPNHEATECLLCQQPLDPSAQARVATFDAFFAKNVKAQIQAAQRAVDRRRDTLPDGLAVVATYDALLSQLGADEGQLGHRVRRWLEDAQAIREAISAGNLNDVAGLDPPPLRDLAAWASTKEGEADRHRKLEDPLEQKRVRQELAELDARALLSERLDETLAWLRATKRVDHLSRARARLDTGAISRKQSQLTAKLVTDDLEGELRRQLEALRFSQIEVVGCRSKTERGKPLVGLKLRTSRKASLRQVLCDGEQRRLGLAMFLAESIVSNDRTPLVIDDPVGSVDHGGRRHIARTLVELAQRRQVIVFTHDMVFIADLQSAARAECLPVHEQQVYRVGRVTGHVADDLPWGGQSVEKRVKALKARLHKLKAIEERGEPVEYREQAEQFCNYLRQTFERAVEDKVFGGSITRGTPDVHLSHLDRVVCTPRVVGLVRRGLDDNSPWVHDRERARNEPPPTSDELQEGLELLHKLLRTIDTELQRLKRSRASTFQAEQLQLAPGFDRNAA